MKRVYILTWWDKEENRMKQYTCHSRKDMHNTLEENLDLDIERDEFCDYIIKVIEIPENDVEDEFFI